MKVAVVILNWNGRKFLEKYLPSVVQFAEIENYTVIVADNNSNDDSISFLQAKYPAIEIIVNDKNYGFAEGYNKALNKVNAEFYVLLNSDIEVKAGWLRPIIDLMESDNNIAACQPKIRSMQEPEKFEYAGASGGFIDSLGYPFCRGRILDTIEVDNGQFDDTIDVFWATGACLVVRAPLYHLVGGLDARFFAHMEEIDLCWRLKNQGYKIKVVPQCVVHHVGGGTLPNNNPRKLILNYRNNLLLLYKNLPKRWLFTILFVRMMLDMVSSVIYILRRQWRFSLAVHKAHASFVIMLPSYCNTRKMLKTLATTHSHAEMYKGSILWQFFVKHKRFFNQLNFKP